MNLVLNVYLGILQACLAVRIFRWNAPVKPLALLMAVCAVQNMCLPQLHPVAWLYLEPIALGLRVVVAAALLRRYGRGRELLLLCVGLAIYGAVACFTVAFLPIQPNVLWPAFLNFRQVVLSAFALAFLAACLYAMVTGPLRPRWVAVHGVVLCAYFTVYAIVGYVVAGGWRIWNGLHSALVFVLTAVFYVTLPDVHDDRKAQKRGCDGLKPVSPHCELPLPV